MSDVNEVAVFMLYCSKDVHQTLPANLKRYLATAARIIGSAALLNCPHTSIWVFNLPVVFVPKAFQKPFLPSAVRASSASIHLSSCLICSGFLQSAKTPNP